MKLETLVEEHNKHRWAAQEKQNEIEAILLPFLKALQSVGEYPAYCSSDRLEFSDFRVDGEWLHFSWRGFSFGEDEYGDECYEIDFVENWTPERMKAFHERREAFRKREKELVEEDRKKQLELNEKATLERLKKKYEAQNG